MKHIIIGASGLIGNSLYSILKNNNEEVIGTYSNHIQPGLIRLDITEANFKDFIALIGSDDVVYLLAAYSNPSWIHKNKIESEKLNLNSTIKLIDLLKVKSPRIIFMSSVEVFDGVKGDYLEYDAPNPLNYYGQMKHKIEVYLKNNYKKYTIVRTGWNVGLDKKSRCVVKLTYESLLKPGAKMALDNKFSISSVEDTAKGLYALSKHKDIDAVHICSDGVISRTLLASMICKNSVNAYNMDYSECLFDEVEYTEPRGRVNNLNNILSKNLLGLKYKNSEEVILDKIKFIDKNE